jgi:nitrogen fixation protein NifZ
LQVFATNRSKACASNEEAAQVTVLHQLFSHAPATAVGDVTTGPINSGSKGNNMTKDREDIPPLRQLEPGDRVYARVEIRSDGSIPGLAADALLATAGTRGVIVNIGHLEENPGRALYLVRFEDGRLDLGPPVGCWPEELVTRREAGDPP